MTRAPLTKFQLDILLLAYEGKSNRQIAAATEKPFNCIITTLGNIKRKGYKLPDHRPMDATAEKARKEKRGRKGVTDYTAASRFTATGVKESTGERFEITSDDQEHSDKWLAYMVAT